MQKSILILLVVLVFSAVTRGQGEAETSDLEEALQKLTTASASPGQPPGPKAKLQRDAKRFLQSPAVLSKNYTSVDFEKAIEDLKSQAVAIGGEGQLVTAVNGVHQKATAYKDSIKKEPVTPPDPLPKAATPLKDREHESILGFMSPYILPGVLVLMTLSVLTMLLCAGIAVKRLHRATNDYFVNVLPRTLSGVKARQDEIVKQIDAAAGVSRNINQRLEEVQTEIRRMGRMLQQANLAGNRTTNSPTSYAEPFAPPPSNGPIFPIAADELLRQMQTKSVVVKRDFQNDMLVSDPDGKGELVVIRDSRNADGFQPLFIVPRVTQFQMKQEYYNFYEKYYECANPESGSVWILDPAVVEKVVGGWELREKGRLEVR